MQTQALPDNGLGFYKYIIARICVALYSSYKGIYVYSIDGNAISEYRNVQSMQNWVIMRSWVGVICTLRMLHLSTSTYMLCYHIIVIIKSNDVIAV